MHEAVYSSSALRSWVAISFMCVSKIDLFIQVKASGIEVIDTLRQVTGLVAKRKERDSSLIFTKARPSSQKCQESMLIRFCNLLRSRRGFSDWWTMIRGTEQKHSVAAIKSDDGRLMLIDLGPATAENIPANAAPGDHIAPAGRSPPSEIIPCSLQTECPLKMVRR